MEKSKSSSESSLGSSSTSSPKKSHSELLTISGHLDIPMVILISLRSPSPYKSFDGKRIVMNTRKTGDLEKGFYTDTGAWWILTNF